MMKLLWGRAKMPALVYLTIYRSLARFGRAKALTTNFSFIKTIFFWFSLSLLPSSLAPEGLGVGFHAA